VNDYNIERMNGENSFRHMSRLCIAKLNKEIDIDWSEIINMFNLDCSPDTLRKKSYGYRECVENEEMEKATLDEGINYKESMEITPSGEYRSDKLIRMNAEQDKDVDFLLEAHGFDIDKWELVSARNNIWNVYSKQDGVQQLYSSKISVKPKNGLNYQEFIEMLEENAKSIIVEVNNEEDNKKMLEIPLYDMHFGISSYEYYYEHLLQIVRKIKSAKWNKIMFVIGQDLLHNDNFRGQTANGTDIDKVDMKTAFNDALKFYTNLITHAGENASSVDCIYVKGNHDESMSYGLFRTLDATFKGNEKIKFIDNMKQRIGYVWEDIFIGLTHGDKGHNRMVDNFMSEYGKLLAIAKVREIHAGHLHSEKLVDKFGIVQRTLATANKTDEWHDDNGFVGANKRFQIFEYSPTKLDAIYYIQ